MTNRFANSAGAVLAAAIACASPGSAKAQTATIVPQPFPPQYSYPVPTATVQGWVTSGNTQAMRDHAWMLWQAMGTPSGQIYRGENLPIWETWYGTEDLFPANAAASNLALLSFTRQGPIRAFVSPRQFRHQKTVSAAGAPQAAPAGTDADRVVSFNKFNPDAATFIVAAQPGPGGTSYSYTKQASLNALNAAWPQETPVQARGINEFPAPAIELKPVVSYVKATGLTPQPLWQGPAGSTNAINPTPGTWTTCILIDPAGGQAPIRPATPQEIASANNVGPTSCQTYLYGPLSLFYSFKLSQEEATAWAAEQPGIPFSAQPAAGDFAVLVAMHANTKEITNWTWQTFWWQPGADTPNGFPGSKAGQPASLPSPWNNYATCTNYDQTTTPGGSTMQVCFNPYLETSKGIPSGLTSNCMSCHGVARVTTDSNELYPPTYRAPITFFTDPAYFDSNTTHTDFSWAVADAP